MTDREPSAILTDEQIAAWKREAGFDAYIDKDLRRFLALARDDAFRLGMLRAAEIADGINRQHIKEFGTYISEKTYAGVAADAIRAAAEASPPPREP